jgi:hypothetical protein
VNLNQILLSLKKNLIIPDWFQKNNAGLSKGIQKITMSPKREDWIELYKNLFQTNRILTIRYGWNSGIQKTGEANSQFGKSIERNYEDWYAPKADKPVQSAHVVQRISTSRTKKKDKPILFVVIDNLRYDQWKTFESVVGN